MRVWRLFVALFVFVLLVAAPAQAGLPVHQAGTKPVTPESLLELVFVADAQIAPDGSRVAFVHTVINAEKNRYQSHIWVVESAGGRPRPFTYSAGNETHPRWSPDGRWLAFLSTRPLRSDNEEKKRHPAQLWLLPTEVGEARPLTQMKHGVRSFVWAPDSTRIAFLAELGPEEEATETPSELDPSKQAPVRVITRMRYKADGQGFLDHRYTQLFIIGLDDPRGTLKQLTSGSSNVSAPAWSPDGSRLAFSSNRTPDADYNNNTDLWTVPAEGGELVQLTTEAGPQGTPVWSPDGAQIVFLGARQRQQRRFGAATATKLWAIATGGGRMKELTGEWDRRVGNRTAGDTRAPVSQDARPKWSPDGTALYFIGSDRGNAPLFRIPFAGPTSRQAGGPPEMLTHLNGEVLSFSVARDGRIALVYGDATHPAEVYLRLGAGGRLRPLTYFNADWLEKYAIAEPEAFWFRGASKWEIQGWILKPPDFDPEKNYPLLLQIHGGPHAQYGNTFFHEFQLLASAGYVVLYTNPRGSVGYGQGFAAAIQKAWGQKDYIDLMKAVDAVITRDYIDPKRLGVLGGSFGGYMTNWIVGHTDRFAAAITMRCVSNLESFYGQSDAWRLGDLAFGKPWFKAEKLYRKLSPIRTIKKVRTPLLIIHSEEDIRTPIGQGEEVYVALKRMKRPVEMVRFPRSNHNLSRTGEPRLRVERLRHIQRWLDTYLKPAVRPAD
ncbi:MAG: S9 family peptidase [Terriglobia bacterium]